MEDTTAVTRTFRIVGDASIGGPSDDPIIRNTVDHGTIGLVSENIDLSENGGNTHRMVLDGNVTLAFTNPPAINRMERLVLHIIQDGSGGHAVTFPGSLLNPPTIDTSPDAINRIEIYTFDNGTTYHTLSADSGILGATRELDNLTTTSINANLIPQAGKLLGDSSNLWSSVWANNLKLGTAGVLDATINQVYGTTNGLRLNTPDAKKIFFEVNGVPIFDMNSTVLTGPNIILSDTFTLQDSLADPLSNGQFTRNDVDVKVYSGGAVRNLSDIGAAGGANVFLSNLSSPTSINQNLIPQAGKLLGDSSNLWSSAWSNNYKFGTAGVLDSTISMLYGTANGMELNVPSAKANIFRVAGNIRVQIDNNGLEVVGTLDTDQIQIDPTAITPTVAGHMVSDGTDVFVYSGGAVRNLSDIGGGGPPFDDNQVLIQDEIDNTKTITFGASLLNASASVLMSYAAGASRTYTFPNITGQVLMDEGAQTITGLKTFEHGNLLIEDSDQSNTGLLVPTNLSADRTYTFPDKSGTVAMLDDIGGIAFPIEPTITDNSSTWTGTQTLDLDVGNGHVYKWTVDQDLTFASSVSNKPSPGTQRTFELEFVHDGVGGTFTVTLPSNFEDEKGNALASFDISSGRVLLSCRINDGTNFLVFRKNITATVAASLALDDLTDVTITVPTTGEYLRYNGSAWVDSPIPLADLALTDGKIIIGNGSGVAAEQTVSGDITITNTGVATIANDAVTTLKIIDNAVTLGKLAHGTANKFIGFDGSGVPVERDGTASPLTTKGDLFGFSTVDARIPVGSNGQVLTADSAEALGVKWAAIPAGVSSLDDLSDVSITSPTTLQVLRYNGATWVNANQDLDDLNNVIITAPATNAFLKYDGADWVDSLIVDGDLPATVMHTDLVQTVTAQKTFSGSGISLVVTNTLNANGDVKLGRRCNRYRFNKWIH